MVLVWRIGSLRLILSQILFGRLEMMETFIVVLREYDMF